MLDKLFPHEKHNDQQIRPHRYTNAWEQRKLYEIANRFDNFRIPVAANLRVPGSTPYYGANGIQDYVEGFTHEGEYILVAEDGANDFKNYPVQCVNGRIWVNNHAHVLQSKANLADNNFLTFAIGQTDFESILVGSSRAKLNADTLMEITVSLPTKVEQIKIGIQLTRLDNLITLQQRKLKMTKDLKKHILYKLLSHEKHNDQQIRPLRFTNAWEQRKLGEMGSTYAGLSGKSKSDFGHGDGKYVTYMNVFSNTLTNEEMVESIEIDGKQNEVRVGDVFFTTSSETPEEVGMTSVMLENMTNTYLNSFCFGYRPAIKLDIYFLAYMLRSKSFREKIIYLAQGISRYNISKNKVMEIDILFPQQQEQKMIGNYFKTLDNLITLQQRKPFCKQRSTYGPYK